MMMRLLAALVVSGLMAPAYAADYDYIRTVTLAAGDADGSVDVTGSGDGDNRLAFWVTGRFNNNFAGVQQLSCTIDGVAMDLIFAGGSYGAGVDAHLEVYAADESQLTGKTGSLTVACTGDDSSWFAAGMVLDGAEDDTLLDSGSDESEATTGLNITGIDAAAGDIVVAFTLGGNGDRTMTFSDSLDEKWDVQDLGLGAASSAGAAKASAGETAEQYDLDFNAITGRAFGWVGVFAAQSSSPCEVDDASPVPGTTISVTNCPAFAGSITTLTSPEGDAIAAESGADTTSADFIIPARTEFDPDGSMPATQMDVDGTWLVGDGSTTEELTLQVDPPAGEFFAQTTCQFSTPCPGDSPFQDLTTYPQFTGLAIGDDLLVVQNSGTCALNANGSPTGTGSCDISWYDVDGAAWGDVLTYTFPLLDPPVVTDLVVETFYGAFPNNEDNDNLGIGFQTSEAGGTCYYCIGAAEGDLDEAAEVAACSGGADDDSAPGPSSGGLVEFTSADLPAGVYYVGTQCTTTGGASNVLTDGPFTIELTAPTVTIGITNLDRVAGTYDLEADIDEAGTAWRYGSANDQENEQTIIDNGLQFTPTIGTNTFTGLAGSGVVNWHFYVVDAFGNETVASAAFYIGAVTILDASIDPDGDGMTIVPAEPVSFGAGGSSGLTLTGLSGGAVTLSNLDDTDPLAIHADTSRTIGQTETGGVLGYAQPGDGIEADLDGADLASFAGFPVDNGSTVGPPVMLSFEVQPDGVHGRALFNKAVNHGAGGSGGWSITGFSGGAVTGNYASGAGSTALILDLSRPVLLGETGGEVGYTNPGDGIEADDDNSDLASFSGVSIANASTERAPFVVSRSVDPDGDSLRFNMSEAVDEGSGGAGGFSATASGGAIALSNCASGGGTAVVCDTDRTVGKDETDVEASYTQPGDGFEDAIGLDVASFADQTVTNGSQVDLLAPTVIRAQINGTQLRVVHSEAVTHGAGGTGGRSLTCSGGPVTPTYASGADSATLIDDLSREVDPDEDCLLAFTQAGDGVEDLAGNDLASFSDLMVSMQAAVCQSNARPLAAPISRPIAQPIACTGDR